MYTIFEKNQVKQGNENKKYYLVNEAAGLYMKVKDREAVTMDGVKYNVYVIECADCGSDKVFITSLCGKEDVICEAVGYGDLYYNGDGDIICSDCENDYYYCVECDEKHHADEMYLTRDGDYICEDCRYSYYCECENCGDIIRADEARSIEDEYGDAVYYCEDCYSDVVFDYSSVYTDGDEITGDINDYSPVSAVHGWHNNPLPFTARYGRSENYNDETMLIGAELETSAPSEDVQRNASVFIARNLNARIEDDSSVSGYAMEVISDPQSPTKWLERRPKVEAVFDIMKGAGITSHDNGTCGLHFHVNRACLGSTENERERTINNILLIMENFKDNLIKLSRREREALKRWGCFLSDYDGNENDDLRDTEKLKKAAGKGDRYIALNLRNYETIEFRFLRGTLNASTFYASLQLIINIVELAKREDVRGISFKRLIHLHESADLIDYAKERGCDNSAVIVNKYKAGREVKERRQALKKYRRFQTMRENVAAYIYENRAVIDYAYNVENERTCPPSLAAIRFLKDKENAYRLISQLSERLINNLRYAANDRVETASSTYYYIKDLSKIYSDFNELKALVKGGV